MIFLNTRRHRHTADSVGELTMACRCGAAKALADEFCTPGGQGFVKNYLALNPSDEGRRGLWAAVRTVAR